MDRFKGLPRRVTETVRGYLAQVDRIVPGFVDGLYLVGSLALDDYRVGVSDIDFIALVPSEPDATILRCLANVHDQMAGPGLPVFDGVYLTRERLSRCPGEIEHAPFSGGGKFRSDARCFEVNPVVWACLARHGIAVRGPEPAQLGIAVNREQLRRFQLGNLNSYWTGWIAEAEAVLARKGPDEDMSAASFSWGVLGVARIARTIATGDIVSKTEAGRWAWRAYPAEWHPVIEDAMRAREGQLEHMSSRRFSRSVDFMRFAISRACRIEA